MLLEEGKLQIKPYRVNIYTMPSITVLRVLNK